MESNDLQEKEKPSNSNDKNENLGSDHKNAGLLDEQQKNTVPHGYLANEKLCTSTAKIIQHKNIICQKLAKKRQLLELRETEANNSKGKRMENDSNAAKVLESVRNKSCSKALPVDITKQSADPNIKPRYQLTRKQLQALVEGFQELVFNISLESTSLRTKVENTAQNIKSLKNFPIFPIAKDALSVSKPLKQKIEFQSTYERSKKSIRNGLDLKEVELSQETESKKVKPSPAESFAKYINQMLREHLGNNQQDKIEKYKCLPSHIEDLEPLATALVKEGCGCIVENEIRINRKNNRQAFISMSTDRDTDEKDGIVYLPVARRYAFQGDIVRAFVLNPICNKNTSRTSSDENEELVDDIEVHSSQESEVNDTLDNSNATIPEKENCRKAFVIRIIKQTELREVVGSMNFLHPTAINSELHYQLKPHDIRMPMIMIPKKSCMNEITANRNEDVFMIYIARVLDIDFNGHCIGELVQPVGKVGNLQAEIKAILFHNELKDIKPFEQKYNDMYEGPMSPPSNEELKYREDLRKKCVFTIDPLTAKDLDDAVSVEKINDFVYEIGVHISDVSFYLKENSDLDNLVRQRTTSIYLVNEVIHMLPTSLCLRCSLLPGEERLAFSVFWKCNAENMELSAPRFTRSIINSCSQIAYEHAQMIIDNPEEELNGDNFPVVLNDWKPNDIKWRILFLHRIAQNLREKRYENGALSINNPKIRFHLNGVTGEPFEFEVDERAEANFLIEEFMLLANQSVAKFIHAHFPEKSILRNHMPPLAKSMKIFKERLNNIGLEFDITSSKSIYESMKRLCRESEDPKAVEACLNALLIKPMARANYFCSEGKTSDADLWHYALSIPIYTHFTSPIRRYPDIMVHRLLAAALSYCPPPQRTTEDLHHIVKICNDQKFNAKNAGDETNLLFFKRYLKDKQSITLKGVVTEICDNMLNVVTIETGHTVPITYSMQNCVVNTSDVPRSVFISKDKTKPRIKLQLFATLDVKIILHNEQICGFFDMFEESSKNNKVLNNKPSSTNSRKKSKLHMTKNEYKNQACDFFYAEP